MSCGDQQYEMDPLVCELSELSKSFNLWVLPAYKLFCQSFFHSSALQTLSYYLTAYIWFA